IAARDPGQPESDRSLSWRRPGDARDYGPGTCLMFETRNLVVGYGKIKALHGISLKVERGQVVALIGGNGAGKSTFLKTVSGLLRPAAGEIYFEGQRIDGLAPHEITRRGIVQIPEGRRIFPLLNVEENLMMGAFFRRDHAAVDRDRDRIF